MRATNVFIGRDKGRAVIVLAPDRANAQQMVDASTVLYLLGRVPVVNEFTTQGIRPLEVLLAFIEAGASQAPVAVSCETTKPVTRDFVVEQFKNYVRRHALCKPDFCLWPKHWLASFVNRDEFPGYDHLVAADFGDTFQLLGCTCVVAPVASLVFSRRDPRNNQGVPHVVDHRSEGQD